MKASFFQKTLRERFFRVFRAWHARVLKFYHALIQDSDRLKACNSDTLKTPAALEKIIREYNIYMHRTVNFDKQELFPKEHSANVSVKTYMPRASEKDFVLLTQGYTITVMPVIFAFTERRYTFCVFRCAKILH